MSLLGCADPYVKVVLLYNGQCIGKKKTQVKKKTLNPTFNESFMFDLPPACYTPVPGSSGRTRLQGIRLHFTVYDWDRVTRNEVIGRLEIGDQAQRPEMGDQAHDARNGRPGPLQWRWATRPNDRRWGTRPMMLAMGDQAQQPEMGDQAHDADSAIQRHWNEVVNCPRKQVAEWHRLHP